MIPGPDPLHEPATSALGAEPAPAPAPIVGGPTPRGRRRLITGVVAGLVVASAAAGAAGFAIGRTQQTPSQPAQAFGGGTFTSPFGEGGPSFSPPFGTTTPSTSAAVPRAVTRSEAGLVDINTTLNYQQSAAAGTGIVLSSNGLILTNNHVIDGATTIRATDLGNHQTYSATVVGYDATSDVAVLRLTGASGLTTATFASSPTRVGQSVYAVGNADGLGGTPTVTAGRVTSLDQSITAGDPSTGSSESLSGLIETDATLIPGDSGGALTTAKGRVVGMDTAASSTVALGSSAQGYAIPITTALSIAHEIISGQASSTVHVGPTALLGVEISSSAGSAAGVAVAGVIPSTPAASAGLVAGATITRVGSATVTTPTELLHAIDAERPGQQIVVTWTDPSGASHTASVTLTSGPPQ
ncbi:MAG: S1C family serine protease [Acidimicrobiales bacterium]